MIGNWMGRYKEFCDVLTKFGNITARNATFKVTYPKYGFSLSAHEWQVLEFLLMNPDNSNNMTQISEKLGIAVSSFSKCCSKLVKLGLLEKYKTRSNKKILFFVRVSWAQNFMKKP